MSIPIANFDSVIFLLEINLQCKVINRSAIKLREYADYWIDLNSGIDNGTSAAPIDIIAVCTACLSAAASIRKLLFHGDRKGVTRIRCDKLMALLGNPLLPTLSSAMVRNSWEHLDERLDALLSAKTYDSFSEIHVAVKAPDSSTFVLRCFDPVKMEIRYGGDVIALEPCINEAKELSDLVSSAFQRLNSKPH